MPMINYEILPHIRLQFATPRLRFKRAPDAALRLAPKFGAYPRTDLGHGVKVDAANVVPRALQRVDNVLRRHVPRRARRVRAPTKPTNCRVNCPYTALERLQDIGDAHAVCIMKLEKTISILYYTAHLPRTCPCAISVYTS